MTTLSPEAVKTLARRIDRPEPLRCPVTIYVGKLRSESSRQTMRASIRLALRAVFDEQLPEHETEADRLARIEREDHRAQSFPWEHVTPPMAGLMAARVAALPLSAATRNKALNALRGIFRACWSAELIDGERRERLTAELRPVRAVDDRLAGREITMRERRQMFDACREDSTPRGRRDAALLALMNTGLRRSEIAALDLDHLNPTTGELRILQSKHGASRTNWLDPAALEAVREWLAARGDAQGALLLPVTSSGQVLHEKRRRATADQMKTRKAREDSPAVPARLSDNTIRATLKRIAERAQITDCACHDWRRTTIGDLIDDGHSIASVAAYMGHRSIETTARYCRNIERKAQATGHGVKTPFQASCRV